MLNNKTDGTSEEFNRFKDKVTDKKIHDHLSNESDEITEKDIDNIVTGDCLLPENVESCGDAASEVITMPADAPMEETPDEQSDENPNHGNTPWNVVDAD